MVNTIIKMGKDRQERLVSAVIVADIVEFTRIIPTLGPYQVMKPITTIDARFWYVIARMKTEPGQINRPGFGFIGSSGPRPIKCYRDLISNDKEQNITEMSRKLSNAVLEHMAAPGSTIYFSQNCPTEFREYFNRVIEEKERLMFDYNRNCDREGKLSEWSLYRDLEVTVLPLSLSETTTEIWKRVMADQDDGGYKPDRIFDPPVQLEFLAGAPKFK